MSLLDSNIQNYEIKSPGKIFSRHWNVVDIQGNNLGIIKTGFGEFGTYTLLDNNDSEILTCKKKLTFRGLTFQIKDSSKTKIGLVKKKGQTKFSTEIWIEDTSGKEIFRSEVPLGPNIVEEIYDNHGEVIGSFSTVKRQGFDPSNIPIGWTLAISIPSVNRIQIWGLFLSVLNAFNPAVNWMEGGDMGG